MLNVPTANNAFKCKECTSGIHTCFACKQPHPPSLQNVSSILSTSTSAAADAASSVTRKCSSSKCGRYYHDECARSDERFRREPALSSGTAAACRLSTSSSTLGAGGGSFICPLHTCRSCWSEANASFLNSASGGSCSGRFFDIPPRLPTPAMPSGEAGSVGGATNTADVPADVKR